LPGIIFTTTNIRNCRFLIRSNGSPPATTIGSSGSRRLAPLGPGRAQGSTVTGVVAQSVWEIPGTLVRTGIPRRIVLESQALGSPGGSVPSGRGAQISVESQSWRPRSARSVARAPYQESLRKLGGRPQSLGLAGTTATVRAFTRHGGLFRGAP